jgi:tetraacyldisaccharide-1-P 4'-kinase
VDQTSPAVSMVLPCVHRRTGEEAAARQTGAQGADQVGVGCAGVSIPRRFADVLRKLDAKVVNCQRM